MCFGMREPPRYRVSVPDEPSVDLGSINEERRRQGLPVLSYRDARRAMAENRDSGGSDMTALLVTYMIASSGSGHSHASPSYEPPTPVESHHSMPDSSPSFDSGGGGYDGGSGGGGGSD